VSKSYISKAQLVKLQTLWRQSPWRQEPGPPAAAEREARLAWASELLGREVRSFNELTRREAAKAIDSLSGAEPLHHGDTETRRDQARGMEGRKRNRTAGDGCATRSITLAGAEDIARIEDALMRLGWDQRRFEAWLRSPSSPLARKVANPKLRTVWEANRVWWALKRLLKRAGEWHPKNPEAA
jgi:hypothetical protein